LVLSIALDQHKNCVWKYKDFLLQQVARIFTTAV